MEQEICKKAAEVFSGKDWYKLTTAETVLVEMLVQGGYIIPNSPANGFVGKPAHKA
jgi:hypothetical protein